ncbi:CD226 antigen [Bufo bufo]|uniref:CD226 antigen n=1 Tax=Bufo bufo TaxID=8384 RepID=UPI001ABD9ECF|nr:CD226 antigen [Bufo bufo]
MNIIICLFFLHLIESVHLEEIVDSTLILRRAITLDCKYSGKETLIQAQWSKVNGSFEETMCTIHKSYGTYILQKYMNRLSFVAENSSDLSIILNETSKADIGIYVCYLAVFPIGSVKKVIAVQADDFGPIVPSSHQTFKENTDITLNFLYTLLGHVKQVTVQKFTDGKMDLVAHCEHLMNGRKLLSYGIDFSKHSFLNCSDLQNITLTIRQAAITDEGLYQCHFWLDDKNHTISIEVRLQNTGITSMSKFALICGISLLVIVIFTIAAFCLVRRQNNKRIQVKQVNVSFNSTYPQLDIETVDEEHTYANFVPNSSFSKSWT